METISIRVNGQGVCREAEPRTHLADFLRDDLHLTGTHLGCEHGVCGACTVLVDGQPARACITFAVACAGREITTIEGYDDDPVMGLLRPAFTRHHALQCGFCTPGMLTTARDIVLRIPDADEARVRLELAGNLCRCTGYQGIVNAVLDVLQQVGNDPSLVRRTDVGPVIAAKPSPASARVEAVEVDTGAIAKARAQGNVIEAQFEVPHPVEEVWRFMGDLPAVASCLPGATVTAHEGERVKGSVAIRFGPMSAAFVGAARLERDDAAMRAVLRGAGQDSLSKSRAQGDVAYRLEPIASGGTRVQVTMVYALQGPLAQFSRSGLVKDFVRRMVADFGTRVSHRLDGTALVERQSSAVRMLAAVIWGRMRAFFGRGR